MEDKKFNREGIFEGNPKWEECLKREDNLYSRPGDIRSEFNRDYNRILHCNAYRRLKHKTQVFFDTKNDHICTRIEHVQHVASIAYSIASYLGLNTELTNAIATGHDLGHAPFGHQGEYVLSKIMENSLEEKEGFWHEKNGLYFVDNIELLESTSRDKYNLNLTYGVRDGIILHCGEVDELAIRPRENVIDLKEIEKSNRPSPYTWEGCIVKIADKIAYLGRDIEDALMLKILDGNQIRELTDIIKEYLSKNDIRYEDINNSILIHKFITSICENSNIEKGICFSEADFKMIKAIKDFNYQYIYKHTRLNYFKKYVELIINSIYEVLSSIYVKSNVVNEISKLKNVYPMLGNYFEQWIITYANYDEKDRTPEMKRLLNKKLYNLQEVKQYRRAIIDFISGMSDEFAIKIFNEITTF